jgi:hypothetical protein
MTVRMSNHLLNRVEATSNEDKRGDRNRLPELWRK